MKKIGETLWAPSPQRASATKLRAFQTFVSDRRPNVQVDTYAELHTWSVSDLGAFWSEVWDFCGVIGEKGARKLENGDRMPGAQFFPDSRLSLAENMLRKRGDQPAILFFGENRVEQSVSFDELRQEVSRLQKALKSYGVTAGDRVAGYLPNMPMAVAAMLAANSIGAIWTACSPDFGVAGTLDRFSQTRPKVLFVVDGYFYNGKTHGVLAKAQEIVTGVDSIERCIVVPYAGDPDRPELGIEFISLDDIEQPGDREPVFERFPFDHPAFILYSSGTTGKPKCIVHSAGGVLLKHLEEHQLQTDLGPGDRFFYFTTLSWMMWNWLVTAMASECTIVLYDGSPFFPDGNAMFDLIDRSGTTVFGTSAKFLDAVEKAGHRPCASHDLSTLKSILSTGSVLKPESFDFVYRDIHPDVQLASISGGTDIVGGFASGDPTGEVRRGELQCLTLGMDVQIFDGSAQRTIGQAGELVCVKPFPTMPVGFWGDTDGSRYHAAYFDVFPNVWRHGDWATETQQGGLVVHGRSDTTLNAGGVRIGTAEIYSQVETIEEVNECVVVGQDWDADTRLVLFVVLRKGAKLNDALKKKVSDRIRMGTTPRHVPSFIIDVSDIPKTVSGKISETAVRDLVNGRDVPNSEALANPECFENFRNIRALQS